jgi:uncharacterized protein (TIGR03083 family)
VDPAAHLAHLRRELAAFAACLTGDLTAPVTPCAPWSVADLVAHLGEDNLWVVTAVTEQRGDYEGPPAPREPGALPAWFGQTSRALLAVLEQDPERPAWTIYPPATVGFWRRRRALETLVHRWDAETALGRASVLDPALAADGVAEVIDTMAPRQVTLGRSAPLGQALRLASTDTGESWVLGPGPPAATVSASAPDLLLLLWRRRLPGAPEFRWDGDVAAGRAVLDSGLVP